jgi:hypothetical protein
MNIANPNHQDYIIAPKQSLDLIDLLFFFFDGLHPGRQTAAGR